jgi:hypothetical protein
VYSVLWAAVVRCALWQTIAVRLYLMLQFSCTTLCILLLLVLLLQLLLLLLTLPLTTAADTTATSVIAY